LRWLISGIINYSQIEWRQPLPLYSPELRFRQFLTIFFLYVIYHILDESVAGSFWRELKKGGLELVINPDEMGWIAALKRYSLSPWHLNARANELPTEFDRTSLSLSMAIFGHVSSE
jgi:hypothetical protein